MGFLNSLQDLYSKYGNPVADLQNVGQSVQQSVIQPAEQLFHNDVVAPVQQNIVQPFEQFASRALTPLQQFAASPANQDPTQYGTDFGHFLERLSPTAQPGAGGAYRPGGLVNTAQGYVQNQVDLPIVQGIVNQQMHPSPSTGLGTIGGIAQGVFNATPLGVIGNAAMSGVNSTIEAARTGQSDTTQNFINGKKLSEAAGVTNPYVANAMDIGENALMLNPEGTIGGLKTLGSLSKDASIAENAATALNAGKQLIGMHTDQTPTLDQMGNSIKQGAVGTVNAVGSKAQAMGNEFAATGTVRAPAFAEVSGHGTSPNDLFTRSVPNDPANAPGTGNLYYHGTKSPISDVSELDANTHTSMKSLFGPGVYLTDNPKVASGYSETKGAGDIGTVHAGKINPGVNFLDLEKPIPEGLANLLSDIAKKSLRAGGWTPQEIANDPELSKTVSFSGLKGTDAIRQLKGIAHSTEDLDDMFTQEVHPYLQSQGYGGMSHIGGIQGGTKSNVAILFPDEGTVHGTVANKLSPVTASTPKEVPSPKEAQFSRVPTPEDAMQAQFSHDQAVSQRSDLNSVGVDDPTIAQIQAVSRTKDYQNGKIDAANFPVPHTDEMTQAYNDQHGTQLSESDFINHVMQLPTKTDLKASKSYVNSVTKQAKAAEPAPVSEPASAPIQQGTVNKPVAVTKTDPELPASPHALTMQELMGINGNPLMNDAEKAQAIDELSRQDRTSSMKVKNPSGEKGNSIVSGTRPDGTFGPIDNESANKVTRQQARGQNPEPVSAANIKGLRPDVATASHENASLDGALTDRNKIEAIYGQRVQKIRNQLADVEGKGDQSIIPEGQSGAGHARISEDLRQSVEHPEQIEARSKSARDPEKFKQVVSDIQSLMHDFYNEHHNQGIDIGHRENYLNHLIDLTDAQKQAKWADMFGTPEQRNFQGGYTKSSHFNSIDEARAAGFDIKKGSLTNQFEDFGNQNIRTLKAQSFVNGVNRAIPEGAVNIKDQGIPQGFRQGSGDLSGTAFHPDAAKLEHMLTPAKVTSKFWKGYDKVSGGAKETSLAISGFHPIKLMNRALGRFGGNASVMGRLTRSFFDVNFAEAQRAKFDANGTTSLAGEMGLNLNRGTTGHSAYDDSTWTKIGRYNPLHTFNEATFKQLQNQLGLELVDSLRKKGAIPSDVAGKIALGKEVNAVALTVNPEVILRDPTVQLWSRRIMLAPSVTEAKVTQAGGAIGIGAKTGSAAAYAAHSIMGEVVMTALIAEVGRKVITGSWSPSLVSAFQNDVLAPSLPSNMTNKKGERQVVNLPTTSASELGRPLVSLMNGDPSGATRYGVARLSSGASMALKAATNTDYYGNPIYKPTDSLLTKAVKLGATDLPIGINQGIKSANNTQSAEAGLINAVGLRVGTDPTDPKLQSANQYFANRTAFTKSLDPNELDTFNKVNPVSKDIYGDSIPNPKNAMVSSSKADDLAANPGFAQKYAQYQLANQTPSQGQYQPETTYKQGQAITLNGETYVALKDPGTTIPGSEKPGDKNNVWVGQDNIWKLQGNDLVNALKDRAANDINTSPTDILNSPDKAMNYLNNFGNFQGRSALEHLKGQGNYDPLYDLPQTTASAGPGQISAQQVLLARAETVAGQATDLAKVIKGSTAYQEFIAQEQTYYQQHPLPSYTQGSSDVAPQMTPDEQAAAKTVGSLPLGTGAKTAFYATPAGQDLQNYYKKLDGYNGAKMVSLGATPQQVQIAQLAQQNQNSDIAKATLAIANGTQNSGRVFSSSSSSRRISAGARRAASSLGGVASRTVKAPSAVSRSVNAPSTHTASARKVSAPPASLQRIGLINAPRSKQVTPSHA